MNRRPTVLCAILAGALAGRAAAAEELPADTKTLVNNLLDGAVAETAAALAEYRQQGKAGAAKIAAAQLQSLKNYKSIAAFAGKVGLAVDLYKDPAWTLIKEASDKGGKAAIRTAMKAVLRSGGEAVAERLVFGLAVGLDLFDATEIARDPEEVLIDAHSKADERAGAVRRLLLQDNMNDYQRALVLKASGAEIDPSRYRSRTNSPR